MEPSIAVHFCKMRIRVVRLLKSLVEGRRDSWMMLRVLKVVMKKIDYLCKFLEKAYSLLATDIFNIDERPTVPPKESLFTATLHDQAISKTTRMESTGYTLRHVSFSFLSQVADECPELEHKLQAQLSAEARNTTAGGSSA